MSWDFFAAEEEEWLGVVDVDDEPDDLDADVVIERVPRSGKLRTYPIEKLRTR